MSPEEKEMLSRTLRLSEENNRLLGKLYRAHRWNRLFKVIYWAVLIGAAAGIFYYFQPILDQLKGTYEVLTSGIPFHFSQ